MNHSPMNYLDPKRATAVKETDSAPRGDANQHGYGSKIGTHFMLQIDGKRWHRVYCVCWGNGATQYIVLEGRPHYLVGGLGFDAAATFRSWKTS